MDHKQIEDVLLLQYNYSSGAARLTASRIEGMDPSIKAALETFLQTGQAHEIVVGQYTLSSLINDYGLLPPAAYLTISDLKKNYSLMHEILQIGKM